MLNYGNILLHINPFLSASKLFPIFLCPSSVQVPAPTPGSVTSKSKKASDKGTKKVQQKKTPVSKKETPRSKKSSEKKPLKPSRSQAKASVGTDKKRTGGGVVDTVINAASAFVTELKRRLSTA